MACSSRSCGCWLGGVLKKRRKNGSLSRGFWICTLLLTAILTTAGSTVFSIGASEGTWPGAAGASSAGGISARTGVGAVVVRARVAIVAISAAPPAMTVVLIND